MDQDPTRPIRRGSSWKNWARDRMWTKGTAPFPSAASICRTPTPGSASLDKMGIDVQFLMPSTLYANITEEPGYEAALLPLVQPLHGPAVPLSRRAAEMGRPLALAGCGPGLRRPSRRCKNFGASAAVVYGTVGNRMLSHSSFTPVWDAFARANLPLCVHMGSSYTALRSGSGELARQAKHVGEDPISCDILEAGRRQVKSYAGRSPIVHNFSC